ncbi:hypothetical protein [Oleomonas cavernae]|uniref:hypothetical protein n=1 Tax=Oleomonas cavernae TaxID=2320859 RepID=UPI001314C1AF|nr:hypothetical protein [Oleomonas cavernae]
MTQVDDSADIEAALAYQPPPAPRMRRFMAPAGPGSGPNSWACGNWTSPAPRFSSAITPCSA